MAVLFATGIARSSAVRVLVAVFVLWARLLVPSPAQAAADTAANDLSTLTGQLVICHAGGASDDANPAHVPADPSRHTHDCLLCPACHLVGQVALPALDGLPVPVPPPTLARLAAPPPPATGPPLFVRIAAPPTGPPHPIV